jgi:hypothetical protein
VIVRWFGAILLVSGLVVGLFAIWPSGTAQQVQLIPADVTIHAPGVSSYQLATCQRDWERWGGLSFGAAGILGGPETSEAIPFMQAADRLAEADNAGQSARVFEIAPLVSHYVETCRLMLTLYYQRA